MELVDNVNDVDVTLGVYLSRNYLYCVDYIIMVLGIIIISTVE